MSDLHTKLQIGHFHLYSINNGDLILAPCLDRDVVGRECAEGIDECRCQAGVGDEGNVEVDGCTTDFVTIGEFVSGEVLGNVHHHVDFVLMQEVERLRLTTFVGGPMYERVGNAVLVEVARRAVGGIDFVTIGNEFGCRIEHSGFLLGRASGEQDGLFRDAVPDGEHGAEEGRVGVVADAAHFACTRHVDTENGVGFLQTIERELAGFDADVVEVEEVLRRTFDGTTEHDARGNLDEVDFKYLADEWE